MKNFLYISICLLLFSCGETKHKEQQDTTSTDTVTVISTPVSVPEIKQAYTDINGKLQRGLLDSISHKYDCSGERSGVVTYYSENGALIFIKHSYSEYDHFSAVDQYFVNDGNLFFAYFHSMTWSFESGKAAEGATKDNHTELRHYITKEKPLLCLEKRYVTRSEATDNPKPEDVQNKEITCKPLKPILEDYGKLLAFKDSNNKDCLGK